MNAENPADGRSELSGNLERETLPCPFCGGEAWVKDLAGWEVGCNACGAQGPCIKDDKNIYHRKRAIAAWNERPNVK